MPIDVPAYQPHQSRGSAFAMLGDLAQLQNYKALQEEREARARQIQQNEQEDADIESLAQQYPDDHDAFIKAVYAKGYAGKAAAYEKLLNDGRKSAAEAHKSQIEAETAQLDAGLRTLSSVQNDHEYQIWRAGIAAKQPDLGQLLPEAYDPEQLKPLFNMALSTKDWLKAEQDAAQFAIDGKTQDGIALLFSRADNQQKWDRALGLAKQAGAGGIAAQYGPAWSPEAQKAAATQLEKPTKPPNAPNVGSFEDYVTRTYGANPTSDQILKARKAYGQADDRAPRVSVNVPPSGGFNEAAVDMMARQYLDTGTMPAMGMGNAALAARAAVMNRAAQLDPKRAMGLQQAEFKADASSLKRLQETADTMKAFKGAGMKNLEVFLEQAKNIPDTGVPWLNTPVRYLSKNMVGSDKMPAIDAARVVALREIARITNNPRLTGVLSDSARHEVENLIPENATFPQIKRVVQILVQDMKNVQESTDQQLAEVRGRIGGQPPAATAPSAAGPKVGERRKFGDKIGEWDGKGWKPVQ